jgi:YD repeat-containing protein
MFFDTDLKGDRLPPKTLCLTYDDGPGATTGPGPGPRTEELARFLFEQDIAATFFVIGRHAEQHLPLLRRLRDWDHLIGNHTYSHPGLVAFAKAGGDVAEELDRTDRLIRAARVDGVVFFRAPYGNWRDLRPDGSDEPRSLVADRLNRIGAVPGTVGPVNWDISAQDWECWEQRLPAAECARRFVAKAEQVGRGIVLMHDSSADEAVQVGNRAAEATALLVPELRALGYRFVRLDAVPQVASAARVTYQVALRTPDGRALGRPDADDAGDEAVALGVVPIDAYTVALRAANGLYLSARGGVGQPVRADGESIGEAETFVLEDASDGRTALRTADGHWLACDDAGRLVTEARPTGRAGFTVHRLFGA